MQAAGVEVDDGLMPVLPVAEMAAASIRIGMGDVDSLSVRMLKEVDWVPDRDTGSLIRHLLDCSNTVVPCGLVCCSNCR